MEELIMNKKILDLSIFEEETLDITLMDNRVIHIVKPTEAMVIKVLQMRNISEKSSPEAIIKAFNSLTMAILNSNDAGIVFDTKYVEELSMKMKSAIINAYSDFITGLQSNPT